MEVKSDIEIAQEAVMENIASVAAKVASHRMTWRCMVSTKQRFQMTFLRS